MPVTKTKFNKLIDYYCEQIANNMEDDRNFTCHLIRGGYTFLPPMYNNTSGLGLGHDAHDLYQELFRPLNQEFSSWLVISSLNEGESTEAINNHRLLILEFFRQYCLDNEEYLKWEN